MIGVQNGRYSVYCLFQLYYHYSACFVMNRQYDGMPQDTLGDKDFCLRGSWCNGSLFVVCVCSPSLVLGKWLVMVDWRSRTLKH